MEHLLKRKAVRSFLNNFSEQQWDSVIAYTLEYGIMLLIEKYSANQISVGFLANLLKDMKVQKEDDHLSEGYRKERSDKPARGCDSQNMNSNADERFVTSYNSNTIESNRKQLNDYHRFRSNTSVNSSKVSGKLEKKVEADTNKDILLIENSYGSPSNHTSMVDKRKNLSSNKVETRKNTIENDQTYNSAKESKKNQSNSKHLVFIDGNLAQSKYYVKEGSFEVVETGERPKNSDEKRRLRSEYEEKRRNIIRSNQNLSIGYSPAPKKIIHFVNYCSIKEKKGAADFKNVQSKIKEHVQRDRERNKHKQASFLMNNNLSNNPEHITINSLNEEGKSKLKNSMSYSKYDEMCNENSSEIKKDIKEKTEYLDTNNKITAAVTNQTNLTEIGFTEDDTKGNKQSSFLRDKIKEKQGSKDIVLIFDEKTRQLTLSNNSPSSHIIIQHKPDDSQKVLRETKEVQTEQENVSMQDLKGKCKFVMILDENSKNTYLVNSNFVYPVPEWKYGNQYQPSSQHANNVNSVFGTTESDYHNLKPICRSHKSNFSEYKESKLSNPIKDMRNNTKENLDDTSNFYFPFTNTASDFTMPHEVNHNPNFQHKYSSIVNDHKMSENRSYCTYPIENPGSDINNYKMNMNCLNSKVSPNINSYDNFTLQAEPIDEYAIATSNASKQLNLNSNTLVPNTHHSKSKIGASHISNLNSLMQTNEESSQPYIRKVNPQNKFQSN